MKAYQTDSKGFFFAEVERQKSPLEKGVFLLPHGAIEVPPPTTKENETAYWNGNIWEIKPDFSNKTYYDKVTKEEKKLEKGQSIPNEYTEIIPLQNETFQKWDENSNNWIVDEKAKEDALIIEEEIRKEFELKTRQSTIQRLLLESDYIELPSFLERKGQEIYNLWITYRNNLRAAYHDTTLPIPEKPQ